MASRPPKITANGPGPLPVRKSHLRLAKERLAAYRRDPGRVRRVSIGSKPRSPRKYAVRAVVFQEGEWLCARCLEYDFVVQAKTPQQLSRALQLFIVGHIAVRLRHNQRPFRDLRRAPEKYWAMFRRSRLTLPAPIFRLAEPVNKNETVRSRV